MGLNIIPRARRSPERPTSKRLGVACGVAAYVAWGLVPLYFKQVASVPPLVVLAHRIVWSVVCLSILVTIEKLWPEVNRCFRSRAILLWLTGSTMAVLVYSFPLL